jgi:hypothetical protein
LPFRNPAKFKFSRYLRCTVRVVRLLKTSKNGAENFHKVFTMKKEGVYQLISVNISLLGFTLEKINERGRDLTITMR